MSDTVSGILLKNETPRQRLRMACERALLDRGWNQGQSISFGAAVQMSEDVATEIVKLAMSGVPEGLFGGKK